MKIEYYTSRNAPLWFWMGIGLYLFLTLCGIFSAYFIKNSFILSIIWGTFGVYGIYYFALSPYKIILSENKIEYKNLFGKIKTFSTKEITFTEEYELQEDRSTIFAPNQRREQKLVLYIHFPKYRVKIYQDYTPQYDEILDYCKRKLQRVNEPNKKYRYFMPLWVIIGFFIVHFVFVKYCDGQKLEGKAQIIATYDSHNLKHGGKGSSSYYLDIYLKEHSNLSFGTWRIDSEYKNKIDSILRSKPHTFVFTISRDDYEKKIKKSVPMEFCDKYMDRNFVEVLDKLEHIENDKEQKIFVEVTK